MGLADISIIIGTVAFVVLVIYIARFLHAACKTMQKAAETLDALQQQIDDLGDQPQEFFHHANELSSDINYKLSCLDPLFRAVENVGERLEYKTAYEKKASFCQCFRQKVEPREEDTTTMQAIELVAKAVGLWQDFKKRR